MLYHPFAHSIGIIPGIIAMMVPGLGLTWHTTSGTNSWSESESLCATHSKTLCTRAQICPNGHSADSDVEGGKRSGDQWAPAADEDNTWVQVGAASNWPSCQTHSEIAGGAYGKPAWGTTSAYSVHRTNIACCSSSTTQGAASPAPPQHLSLRCIDGVCHLLCSLICGP